MSDRLKINWFGSFSQGQGYSGSSELMCVALERLGVDVRLIGLSNSPDQNLTPEGLAIKQKPFEKADVAICYGFPVSFSSMVKDLWKVRIGFTMFETDRLPTGESWAGVTSNATDSCNDLDMLFVPSEHNRKLFSDSGVTVPIEVVHLGINSDMYRFIERPKNRKTFTFLQSGNLSIRKNPGAVLSAFMELFKGKDDVQLIVKTQFGTLGYNWQFPEDAHIKIIDEHYSPLQMEQLLHESDVFVFPSRGEGFGLPPLEAMATGMPAIIALNTGMLEFADEHYVYPVRCVGKKPAQNFPKEWGDIGNWYEPDYSDLKRQMLYVYNNRNEVREKGRAASKWVLDNYTFDNTAKRIVELISKVYN